MTLWAGDVCLDLLTWQNRPLTYLAMGGVSIAFWFAFFLPLWVYINIAVVFILTVPGVRLHASVFTEKAYALSRAVASEAVLVSPCTLQ